MSEDRQTDVPRLEPELLDHLRVEFGEHGRRAAGFLETARRLLEDSLSVPKLGELVAYCLREALTEIPKASATPDDNRWRELSRVVVESAERYKMTTELWDEGRAGALDDLLASVDDLKSFHKERRKVHGGRLIALMIQRAGVEPLSSGTAPVHTYQRLLDRVNAAAHGGCTVAEARQYCSECLVLLRQLFLPPDVRLGKLDELAQLDAPSDAELTDVLDLAATPNHLQRFLRKVTSPRWLWLFEGSDVLNSGGGELWSSACSAAARLADTHRDEVLCWLSDMDDKHGSELERTRPIAHAASQLGGRALDVLLKIVRRHPEDDRVVRAGRDAALALDASDRMVEKLADVLMNESGWKRMIVADRLAAHLVAGIDKRNALGRIKLFCFKLNNVSDHDLVLGLLRDQSGSISDGHSIFPYDRSSVLLGSLTRAVRTAWEWLPAVDLLESTSGLLDPLEARIRAWILAHAPDVDPDEIVVELEHAVASREATGDDVALIDRAVAVCDRALLKDRFRAALGDVPTGAEVARAFGSEELIPESWMRAETWVALVPADFAESWRAACHVIAVRYGEFRRDHLLRHDPIEAVMVGPPIEAEHLRSMPPEQAARVIAQWRPDRSLWSLGQALELARTLEGLVRDNPGAWVSDPVGIATKLHEPIYISHYIGAAGEYVGKIELQVTSLLDVIQLVWSEPWPAVPLGRDQNGYGADWRTAKRSAVDLIRVLVKADADFGHRADEVWNVIESAAKDQSDPSLDSNGTNPMHSAINRSNTRAFETAILLVAAELRSSRPIRPAFQDLLEFGLRLENSPGAYYRAIMAPRIAWLRHALPEWTDSNLDVLFGHEAPEGLAQITIDLAIQWSQPNRWLLKTYPEMIQDAVSRRVERAMQHLLVGMLWELSAYQIEPVVRLLVAEPESQPDAEHEWHPSLVSDAGRQLSNLVGGDEADSHHIDIAVDLWETLLESEAASSMEGFGWMSTVKAMDTDGWVELTLRTLGKTGGRLDWEHEVADRAMLQPATVKKLALLDQMIRGQSDHWVLRRIADNIEEFLTTAARLESTGEYQRLRTALLERGMIDE